MRKTSRQYIQYLIDKKNISENTQMSYMRDLDQMIEFFNLYRILDYRLINETNLNSYVLHLELKGVSNATVTRNIVVMKGYFDYLFRTHQIPECITEDIKRPIVQISPREKVKNSDLAKLLTSLREDTNKGIRDHLIIQLMFTTKISVSALINLTIKDINLELGFIHCEHRNKLKTYALTQEVITLLENYVEEVRPSIIKDESNFILFPNMQGNTMSRQGVWKMVKSHAQVAGLEDITLSRLSKGSR